MISNEKILMENQINKIFNIIENSDTEEISKIAIETIANRCYDSPFYTFIILKNLLDQVKKGNLKIIQDSKLLIDSIFEDFDCKLMEKILNTEIFRDQIEKILNSILQEDEKTIDIHQNENKIFSIDENSNIAYIKKLESINFNILEDFDCNLIENLYSEDGTLNNNYTNENSGVAFNKFEMQILFPDKDEIREEIESCLVKTKVEGGNIDNNTNNDKNDFRNKKKNYTNKCNNSHSQIFPDKLKIQNFYEKNSNSYDINEFFEFDIKKRRRLETDRKEIELNQIQENIKEIYFNPIYFVLNELVNLNSNCNWKTRLCAVTLLTFIEPYIQTNKLNTNNNDQISRNNTGCNRLLNYYKIEINYKVCNTIEISGNTDEEKYKNNLLTSTYTVEEIKVIEVLQNDTINSIIFENVITRLIINSIIDKVVDFNSMDYICLFKELNIKLAYLLLQNNFEFSSEVIVNLEQNGLNFGLKKKNPREHRYSANSSNFSKSIFLSHCTLNLLCEKILKLLENFIKNYEKNKDWQPIFAILIFLKYIFTLNENFTTLLKNSNSTINTHLFNLILNLMKIDSEEILNLTIQILDRLLQKQIILEIIDNQKFLEIFNQFLKLINKYDDIECGVKFYFNCLYNFIIFFKSKGILGNFKNLLQILEKDLIFFSLNKMDSVRHKYFEVLNNLLDCENFDFSNEFIEKNISIAYQGLCCEVDKKILNSQKQFLVKVILIEKNYFNLFFTNHKKFLKLLNKENIKNLKHFFIPSNEKYDFKEMGMIYTTNFKNDLEREKVKINFEKKVFHIAPILSLLLKRKIEFVKILLSFFKIDLNNFNSLILSKKLGIFLKIYFHYLELIELEENKVLILNDEILKKLSDNLQLNDMQFYFNRKEILNNFGMTFKIFLNFLANFKFLENSVEVQKLQKIYNVMSDKFILNTKEILEILKILFDKLKNSVTEGNLNNVFENFQFFKNKIEILEKDSNCNMMKNNIRGYAAISLFLQNLYTNTKIEKVSNFANPILNCLKFSSKESKIFSRNLIKLLYCVNNWESIGKILFTFYENSLNIYIEEKFEKLKISEIENMQNFEFQFLPIKYFFKEFSKFEKFCEIQKMISDYKIRLTNQKANSESSVAKNYLILIYLLTFVKNKTKCTDFNSFYEIFSGNNFIPLKEENLDSVYLKLISIVLLNYQKIFCDECEINTILEKLFRDVSSSSTSDEFKLFLFTILDNLINLSEKFLINSSGYLFEILKFINSKNQSLRMIATNIFSKIMKVVTMLKMDRQKFLEDEENFQNSEKFSTNENKKSFNFIKNFFDQNSKTTKYSQLNIKLKENLRSYQITGINWMTFLGNYGLSLALCDDMGLGKTIQTLVCVVNASKIYKEQNKKNPINLIICPNTLIFNWINEGKKFFYNDEVQLKKIDSDFYIRETIQKNKISNSSLTKNNNLVEIFVTSYEKVRDNEGFSNFEYFYLVLDEAHIVKNPKTKSYQSIKKLKSERRIILTGTPIQNNVMELWALFDFLMPGFLGNENDFEIKFHKKIHSNIKKLNLEEKLQENIFQTSLMEIRKRIKPFVMRRLKQDVLKELPDKIIQDLMCEMTPIQKEMHIYWEKIYEGKEKVNTNTDNKSSIITNNFNSNTLKVIDSLRKICNYPGLLLKEDFLSEIPQFKKIKKDEILSFGSSGKFKALEDLLMSLNFANDNMLDKNLIKETNNCNLSNKVNIKSNLSHGTTSKDTEITDTTYENKVLIFTQYKTMVDKINEFLGVTFSTLKKLKITSDMSNEERINSVSRFNSDPSINILILTTNIGGLGLSLTSANIVIMFDHDWNPMKDLQAMDRAHRIGQKKTVEVFRLITADSIEEKLISLQTFKKYIANNVVDTTKIHETKLNANSFMESLEEFSSNQKIKVKKNTKKNNLTDMDDENFQNELIEIEYLKNLVDESHK